MIFPFKGQYPLTQDWGNKLIINGVDIYGQFGLLGHNGTDWGTPTGTAIIAPHSGKVIECASDPNGYGYYVKIECAKWGSILGHLRSWAVVVGEEVKEEQTIGHSNNTGNSTGPHLHWGLYPIPRNRNNGYSGTVDPFQYIGGIMDDEITIKKSVFEELVRKSSLYDEFTKAGYGSATEVKQLESDLRKSIDDKQQALDSEKERAETFRRDFNDFVAMVAVSLGCVQEVPQIKVRLDEIQKNLDELDDIQRAFAELELNSGKDKEDLNAEIARLKALLAQKNVLENSDTVELVREIVRRLVSIIKRK